MKVPFVDLNREYEVIKKDVEDAIFRVIKRGNYILGCEVEDFEKEFANYLNVKYVISVGNGTDALFISLKALGIGRGDEVIIPAMTFIATAYAVSNAQATPVFVDVDSTGTIDISTKKNIMNFPAGGDRVVRTIGFGKDFRDAPLVKGLPRGSFLSAIKLYASIGSSCDACLENTWKYAAILEADWDGTYTAEVAGGLRDVEFFTFHPTTGALWATEQSRKGFSDEINIIKPTLKYGWPYCYGAQKRDESFTQKTDRTDLPMDCTKTELPVAELPSDMDPRGIAFLSPTELLVATRKKIIKITFDAKGQLVRFDDFITSIQATDLKLENGILYISDDNAGIIYKVSPIS